MPAPDTRDELWLPASAFSMAPIGEVPPGRLVWARPGGKSPEKLLGLRFNFRDLPYLVALTPFFEGRLAPGVCIDISQWSEPALILDIEFILEANLDLPVTRYGYAEPRAGELAVTKDGLALTVAFPTYGDITTPKALSLASWAIIDPHACEIVFGGWRMVFPLPGMDPVSFAPFDRHDKA